MSETVEIENLPQEVQDLIKLAGQSLEPIHPEAAIDRFLERKSSEIRPGTVSEYRRKLEYFQQFCEMRRIENLNDLDGRTIDAYRRWRKTESADQSDPLAAKTMRDEMYLLQDFVNFLEDIEAAPRGLKHKIDIPTLKDGEGVRNIEFDADRLETILEYLEKYEYATLEHVVWVFYSHTGRRPGALHSLDIVDLHLDCENPYIELHHRPEETSLKNGEKGEGEIGLSKKVAQIFKDFIRDNRIEVTTAAGRRPFLTSKHGRLSKSTMRRYIYKWSRPCKIGAECPHDRDVQTCEAAESSDCASKCPSSRPPYALRHGYITQMLREGAPKPFLSDRCDVSEEIIDGTYDERDSAEKRELRQELLNEMRKESTGGGYL